MIAVLLWVCLLSIAVITPVTAQSERWRYDEATAYHFDKLSSQVQLDRWGHEHIVYVSQNVRGAGYQLYYSNNVTGQFTSPILASNFNGTVFDSANAPFRSQVFLLDAQGRAHIAFIANVANEIRIYYTTNRQDVFIAPEYVALRNQFDMAVDSLGAAHIVWVENSAGKPRLRHWNSLMPGVDPEIIDLPVNPGVRLGDPQVEIGTRGLTIAVRCDSSLIFLTQQQAPNTPFDLVQRIVLPTYDPALVRVGRSDLRIRMALDTSGRVHILAPHYDTSAGIRHRLVYVSNSVGSFAWRYLTTDTLDSAVSHFDIASNGGDRIFASWTTEKYRKVLVNVPKVSYMEMARDFFLVWNSVRYHPDLNILLGPGFGYWKNAIQISARGSRVVIGGTRRVHTDSADLQMGLYVRTSVAPRLKYLLPDAAPPGMNVVVESYANILERGSFGPDGLRPDSVGLELVSSTDANRVIVGPTVISWDGRLASTMLFIRPGAQPGPVPVRIRVGTSYSNVDTFFIVTPQHLGLTGSLSDGGMIGWQEKFGRRSKRGVLVVDSLILSNGFYRIDTMDVDPATTGNQGFLPITILSVGPVRIDSGAILDASGWNDLQRAINGIAGPGGGGGGSGGEFDAGSGFTGGGGPGRMLDRPGILGASVGSGGTVNGRWVGGPSLSGASGGATFMEATSGGGTGHPFGASGSFGQVNPTTPLVPHNGGYGAGSGGSRVTFTTGGGGGGNKAAGIGGGNPGEGDNAGLLTGNPQVVPLAGGSGGGGGGYVAFGNANGGGGGGALSIVSNSSITVRGTIRVEGADGVDGDLRLSASGGGGGSGGGILLAAKGAISLEGIGAISAVGGRGGKGQQGGLYGGDGANGRIRIDGHPTGDLRQISPAPGYSGPATVSSTLMSAQAGSVIRGYGEPGKTIRVFTRTDTSDWTYSAPRDTVVRADGTWSLRLGAEATGEKLYVAVLQRVESPSSGKFTSEPEWVMSPAGGNVVGLPSVKLSINDLQFPCIRFDSCQTIDLPIDNPGTISDLMIGKLKITGFDSTKFTTNVEQLTVAAGGRGILRVTFCPKDTGSFSATLRLPTNVIGDDSVKMVTISGCAVSGHVVAQPSVELDLGDLCLGACRDTSVVLRNDGAAALDIKSIQSADGGLAVAVLEPPLPLHINAGDSVRLRLQFCVRHFEDPSFKVVLRSTTIDSVTTLVLRARNVGPNTDFPPQVDFGTVTFGTQDSCATQTVALRNRSTAVPLLLTPLVSTSPNFTILNPITRDTLIAPGESFVFRVRFCADNAGDYSAQILMGFGEGDCRLDTAIRLLGHAIPSGPRLVIVEPDSRSIIFTPTLLTEVSLPDSVVIENLGGTGTEIGEPIIVTASGTDPGEVLLDKRGLVFPYQIGPHERIVLGVRIQPTSLGSKNASIHFSDTSGWMDTVHIFGSGVEPGIQVSAPRLNFRDVRVGDISASQELLVYNVGTAPVWFEGITLADSTQFTVVSVSQSLPYEIQPKGSNDTVKVKIFLKPESEGAKSDTLTVHNSSAQTPVVQLVGNGVLEHVSINRSVIDFGCIPGKSRDSLNVFTLRNTGTYPLIIDSLPVLPASASSRFMVLAPKFPDTLKPGGARSYSMRYISGLTPVSARLLVKSSAPDVVSIDLIGDVCYVEGGVAMSVKDMYGVVNSSVTLPIMAAFDPIPTLPFEYSLTLTYDWDLLAPQVVKGTKAATLNTTGTLSSNAIMTEATPGTLLVSGVIDPAQRGEILVNIPFKVLLGHDYETMLSLSDVRFLPAAYRITLANATFHALDCDTNGGVVVGAGKYALKQNTPNPVEQGTIIHYEIPRTQHVQLNVYNSMGTLVRVLIDEVQQAGVYDYHLDARDLGSGVYTYEMVAGRFRKTYRLVITE